MTGPSIDFTITSSSSTLIRERQQILPSFSMLTTASLSPAFIFAFSLISLGSTICPRSSTLTIDSTLQQLTMPASQQASFWSSTITSAPLGISVYSDYLNLSVDLYTAESSYISGCKYADRKIFGS